MQTRIDDTPAVNVDLPAINVARFNYLIGLARKCEAEANRWGLSGSWRKEDDWLKLAAVYREMAFAAMPAAPDPEVLELTSRERNALTDKLRRMTVANGCTEAEADTALQMLLRLEMRPS
jgi:hypothetical protein